LLSNSFTTLFMFHYIRRNTLSRNTLTWIQVPSGTFHLYEGLKEKQRLKLMRNLQKGFCSSAKLEYYFKTVIQKTPHFQKRLKFIISKK
jgi:hypothetical protein